MKYVKIKLSEIKESFSVSDMHIYANARTAFHDGREVILSHHFLTFGRDSNKLPSPSLTNHAPYGKWKRSAKVNS